MPELTDTHCHIQSAGLVRGEKTTRELWAKAPKLTGDELVAQAVKSGVTRLLCVGCDVADSQLAIQFVAKRQQCWASIGIHPHEAQHATKNQTVLAEFASLVTQPKVVAIGECGLDYFYTHSPKQDQLEILEFQLELARQHKLPLIFHVREAFDDFWPVFDRFTGLSGVVHSFTDNQTNLQKAIDRGLYIGVNGIVTFAKNPAQIDVYKQIPREQLVLETDAPFLTPTPYRGKINEPKQITTIAAFLAELRSENYDELAAITTKNARELFRI
jgi:TatD DNase family protein